MGDNEEAEKGGGQNSYVGGMKRQAIVAEIQR